MTGDNAETVVEQIIIYLVDENILPYYSEQQIFIPDTIYNRQIIFNLFQHFISKEKFKNFVSIEDKIIKVDCSRINELKSYDTHNDLTVNIVNSNKIIDLEPDQPLELLVENPLKEKPEFPVSCFIVNNELEVLSQKKGESSHYFAKAPEHAVCFFKEMAYKLISMKKYKNCFIVEVQSKRENANFLRALQFLMRPVNHKQ